MNFVSHEDEPWLFLIITLRTGIELNARFRVQVAGFELNLDLHPMQSCGCSD